MKQIGKFLTLISLVIVLAACDNDGDVRYNFFDNNYQGTIIYPDGMEFHVNTCSFTPAGTFRIAITVPPTAVDEEDKYKYITSVEGKYEYTRENNKLVMIKLNQTATVTYGTLRDNISEITLVLGDFFPTQFRLDINRKNDKIKDKINSLENRSGVVIIGD